MDYTVLELINAIENSRGGYDDPIRIVRPVVGRNPDIFEIVDINYIACGGTDDMGELQLIVSRI